MSDRGKIQILQIAGAPTYCRRDDTGGGSFSDLDVQVAKLPIVTAENQNMLVDTNDLLYFGSAAAWFGFGLCLNTFGSYGARTWQYYNDTDSDAGIGTPGWMTFTPLYDSTEGFSKHGVVVWGILGNWALFTANGTQAFWVRVQVASVATVAKFYNLLRNITLYEPFKLTTKTVDGGLHDDINGATQETDITNFDERGFLTLSEMGVMTAAVDQQEATTQLKSWQRERDQLWIIDLARTDAPDFSVDSYISNYIGHLQLINGTIESPHKEGFPYSLTFKFETIIKTVDRVTTQSFENVAGTYAWVRDTTGTDASDGGDSFHVP